MDDVQLYQQLVSILYPLTIDTLVNSWCYSIFSAKPTEPPCKDINDKCEMWAYEGECAKRKDYMKKFCRKSCFCQRKLLHSK